MAIQRQLVENLVPADWDRPKQPGSGFNRVRWLQSLIDLFNRPVINRASASTNSTVVNTNGNPQSTGIGTLALQPKRYAEFTVKARVTLNWTGGISAGVELETNGTPNGSQALLNLVAGTNITLTDDGLGDVTIRAASSAPATSLTAGAATFVQGFPSHTSLNISTEGVDDWIALNGNFTAVADIESSKAWTWKAAGITRGRFQLIALDEDDPQGSGMNGNVNTGSPLQLTTNANDPARPFSSSPAQAAPFFAPNNGVPTAGAGMALRVFGDGNSHTYKLYVYLSDKMTVEVIAHADDQSTADVSLTATEASISGTIYSFTFTCKIPPTASVLFTAITTVAPSFQGCGIQALTVF